MAASASTTSWKRKRTALALASLSLVGLGLGTAFGSFAIGCGPAAPPPEAAKPCDVQIVTLRIYAADNVNPNENQNPRPVVIRLYQLKDEMRMQNATYDEVLLSDKEVLADDIVKVDEVSVFPNDLVEVKFERAKEASTLGGVALFHSPKGQSWKTFYAFPLMPGEAQCGGRESDAGAQADPKTAFFVESTKIDNGSEFDESMFPNATSIRRVNLPKASGGNAPPKAAAPAP
ncbi:type VI secretion system lipoprotein TssJ [Polyangium spumosum]|uniref:Type VI secretion system lipoprotein TssJ n=1 Tax=Polyangium spumosum TaxID=889282 RepID=A0A6N7PGS7_9BACT|nr:type VI secretion system lipoprotein TssJ [Polyangium spumosum]MRG91322.1 type VI secretion system lipoprotein TssJ [Polyangium spumosum]